MSSGLPSREQAIELLRKNHCPRQVINHSLAVADLALDLANQIYEKGYKVDLQLVSAGALLHDLGRSKSHAVDHAVVGGQMAEEMGLPKSIICIIKRHVGAGITAQEAEELGWPADVYMPQTIEEKIVSYADKLIDNSKCVPIETEIKRLQKNNKIQAAERVRNLHVEISGLLGRLP